MNKLQIGRRPLVIKAWKQEGSGHGHADQKYGCPVPRKITRGGDPPTDSTSSVHTEGRTRHSNGRSPLRCCHGNAMVIQENHLFKLFYRLALSFLTDHAARGPGAFSRTKPSCRLLSNLTQRPRAFGVTR